MSTTTPILDPVATAGKAPARRWQPLDRLQGKVVGFFDNSKPNFHYLADDIAEVLVKKYGVASVVRHRKLAASIPMPESSIRDAGERCDLVIAGSGD
jgi:hypothetical protein